MLSYHDKLSEDSANLIESTLKRLNLFEIKDQLTYTLSGGQGKRLALASLVQDKDYLILDEVSAMVDIQTKETMRKNLLEERDKSKAILLSSHDIAEIKRVADHIVVLKKGEIVLKVSF